MRTFVLRVALLAAAGVVSGFASPIYSTVVLSMSGGTINGLTVNYSEAELAPDGSVVFSSSSGTHLFTWIDGATTTVDPLGAGVDYSNLFINDSGVLAYSTGSGGAYVGTSQVASGSSHVVGFNDAGTVLWNKQDNNGVWGLYKPSGLVATGNVALVAEMDGSGEVLYETADGTSRLLSGTGAVVAGPGTTIGGTSVVGVAPTFYGNELALSPNGNLALLAYLPSYNAAIVTSTGLEVTPSGGVTVQGLDINDNGTLVWSQFNPSRDGTSAMFTQYGRVVGAGDVIDGKTVSSAFSAGNHFLDNNGDILTSIRFTDGTSALVLFQDTSAPEPATWLLLASALSACIGWRSRALRSARQTVASPAMLTR